jgi:choline dehydrogenase-like flavoprotein
LKNTGESKAEHVEPLMDKDAENIHQMVMASNLVDKKGNDNLNNTMVSLASSGSPESLLDGGYHFEDCPLSRRIVTGDEVTPMDIMYNTVHYRELTRPKKRINQ